MKVRFTTRCEKCKRAMLPGTHAVRYRRRLWHHTCVADYLKTRKGLKVGA